jgi:hypothetical protein
MIDCDLCTYEFNTPKYNILGGGGIKEMNKNSSKLKKKKKKLKYPNINI